MIGSHFMLKTMIAIFSVPLVAQANIHIDLKPLKELVSHQQAMPEMDTAQIQAAVQSISATAGMNAHIAPVPGAEETLEGKTDQEHLVELLANIEALSKQAGQAN